MRSIPRLPGAGFRLASLLCVVPLPAAAADFYVDCSGQMPGAFTSIAAALGAIPGPPPFEDNTILLKGDCTENVRIGGGYHRLWIAPEWDRCPFNGCTTNGPLARITAADPSQPAVSVLDGSDVVLVHLALSGGRVGLEIGDASVTAWGVVAENNLAEPGDGITVGGGGSLNMGEGGARNNRRFGLAVGGGSSANLYGKQAWLQNGPLVISGNGQAGIRVDRAHVDGWAGVVVQDNLGPGLHSYGGDVSFGAICCDQTTLVEGNAGGAFLSEGAEASFWGDTVLRANGPYGIYAEKGSHATLYELPSGPPGTAVLVEDHVEVGVSAVMNSQAAFHGANRIRHNGSAGLRSSAGVRVDGNSQAFFERGVFENETEVSGNVGPGLLADLNSSVDAREAIFRGNTKEGVRLRHMSVASLSDDVRARPNGGGPLTCDATSLAITSLARRTAACWNVEALGEPRPTRPEPLR